MTNSLAHDAPRTKTPFEPPMAASQNPVTSLPTIAAAPTRLGTQAATWTELLSPAARWQIAIVSALMIWLFWHELRRLLHIWTHSGDWSHGLIVPLFSLYFLHLQRHKLAAIKIRPSFLGLPPLLLALLMYAAAIWPLKMGFPKSVSIVLAIVGLVILLAGFGALKLAWLPIAYLLFALPWPPTLYDVGTLPLRKLASEIAAGVLALCPGIELAVRDGTVIRYLYHGQPGELGVAQACSGMRLLMAFAALGVAMAYLSDRPWWHRLVMVLACLPIAVFCNMLRVTLTGLIHIYGSPEYAQGTAHTMLGLLMLFVAFGLFSAILYVLNNLFIEEPEPASPNPRSPEGPAP
jgi:exosortase